MCVCGCVCVAVCDQCARVLLGDLELSVEVLVSGSSGSSVGNGNMSSNSSGSGLGSDTHTHTHTHTHTYIFMYCATMKTQSILKAIQRYPVVMHVYCMCVFVCVCVRVCAVPDLSRARPAAGGSIHSIGCSTPPSHGLEPAAHGHGLPGRRLSPGC